MERKKRRIEIRKKERKKVRKKLIKTKYNFQFSAIKAFSFIKSRSVNNIGKVFADFGKNRPPPPHKGRKPAGSKYPPNGSRAYFVLYDEEEEEENGVTDEYPYEESSESKISLSKTRSKYTKRSAEGASYQHRMSMPYKTRKQFRHRISRPSRPTAPRKS